jgi:Dockerin type I domain
MDGLKANSMSRLELITIKSASQVFTGYALNQWHNIQVNVEQINPDSIHAAFFVDGVYLTDHMYEISIGLNLKYISISSSEKYAWFDDVCVSAFLSCCDTPADYNNDGSFNIADVTAGINRIFGGGAPPTCQDEADCNGDGAFNISDVTYGISRIFSGGSAPICGLTGS